MKNIVITGDEFICSYMGKSLSFQDSDVFAGYWFQDAPGLYIVRSAEGMSLAVGNQQAQVNCYQWKATLIDGVLVPIGLTDEKWLSYKVESDMYLAIRESTRHFGDLIHRNMINGMFASDESFGGNIQRENVNRPFMQIEGMPFSPLIDFNPVGISPTGAGSDGQIIVNVIEPQGAFSYSIDDGDSWQDDNAFSGLEVSDYLVKVQNKEDGNISASKTVTL